MSLEDVLAHHRGEFEMQDRWEKAALNCMLLTDVQELEQIEFLAQSLPRVDFHIACYTEMGAYLQSLNVLRSEERRVGKECRSRWSPYH